MMRNIHMVDRFAVERRAGPAYQSLVVDLAALDPWISGPSMHTCKFCNSVLLREYPREGEMKDPYHHQAACVWRRAAEMAGALA